MKSPIIKVILADDDESDRELFKEALEELKIKTSIETLYDGVLLMEYLSRPETKSPDILFLDLNMPRKGGIECLKEIRAIDKYKNLAIAIYSTSSAQSDMESTFMNGANVYIRKPNDFNGLRDALEKVLKSVSLYQMPPFNMTNFLLIA